MFEVKVTVDLGERTVALLTGIMSSKVSNAVEVKPTEVKPTEVKPTEAKPIEVQKPVEVENPTQKPAEPAKRRTKDQVAAEREETQIKWDGMDDDDRLEAIKTEVTRHTKKGKSADIKFLLAQFDAGRASELSTKDYEPFYNAVLRYGAGEKVDQIFPN